MSRNVAILAWNSWQENLRGRFYLLSVVFGVVVLYASLLLGLLAADQEPRVLLDFGLSLIELMALAGAVYGAATIVLREMETKTVYLILTRPVSRGEYLLGRFLGLALSAAASIALMALAHLAILFAKGWTWTPLYAWALLGAFLKVLITTALTLFLALFSSSVLTALVIALILWTLGHFLGEIRFMIRWGTSPWATAPLQVLSYVVPDLQLFNLRDRIAPLAGAPPEPRLALWLGYAAAYTGVWLAAGRALLRRREF